MSGRERHAALEASIDADRARDPEPSPVSGRSWLRAVVRFGRELLGLDLFTGRGDR